MIINNLIDNKEFYFIYWIFFVIRIMVRSSSFYCELILYINDVILNIIF